MKGVAMVVGPILEYTVVTMMIPYPIQMSMKAWVVALIMLKELVSKIAGLTLMHLRVMVTYIEFVDVFL